MLNANLEPSLEPLRCSPSRLPFSGLPGGGETGTGAVRTATYGGADGVFGMYRGRTSRVQPPMRPDHGVPKAGRQEHTYLIVFKLSMSALFEAPSPLANGGKESFATPSWDKLVGNKFETLTLPW